MGSEDSEVDERDHVLAPDDLDITKQPEVEEIDDGRYVVSPNGPAKKPDKDLIENPDWLDEDEPEDTETAPQPAPEEPQPNKGRTQSSESAHTTQPSTHQPSHPDQSTPSQQSQSTHSQPDQSTSSTHSQPQQPQPEGRQPRQPTPTDQARAQQSGPTESQSTERQSTERQSAESQSTERQSAESQSTERRPDQPTNRELAAHDQPPVDPPAVELTNANVSKFLAESLAQGGGDYGFDATVSIEGQVNRGRMTSDDIGETLETLLRWYARQTTDEVEPESVLGIILAGSDLAVEYPVQSVYSVVKRHGLKPDDSISELLAAVRNEGSFTVPPSDE